MEEGVLPVRQSYSMGVKLDGVRRGSPKCKNGKIGNKSDIVPKNENKAPKTRLPCWEINWSAGCTHNHNMASQWAVRNESRLDPCNSRRNIYETKTKDIYT